MERGTASDVVGLDPILDKTKDGHDEAVRIYEKTFVASGAIESTPVLSQHLY